MLLKFVSIRVPQRYSDKASRRAALYPILGPVDLTQGSYFQQIEKKVNNLVGIWRSRLTELQEANWFLASKEEQFQVCMNCHPSFMQVSPTSLTCKQQNICPFCYTRGIQNLYRTIATICRGIPANRKEDYWLLGYRQLVYLPQEGKRQQTLKQMMSIEKRVRTKSYHSLTPFGGYVGAEFEPIGIDQWKVTRRGILLTPANVDLSNVKWADKIKRVKSPKGDKLAKLIGWTMKYPKKLLLGGDAGRVVRLLHERRHHRLNASYGLFRASK